MDSKKSVVRAIIVLLVAILMITMLASCSSQSDKSVDDSGATTTDDIQSTESTTENTLENKTAEDFVETAVEYEVHYSGDFLITGEKQLSDGVVKSRMPQLTLESSDAETINQDIHNNYDERFTWYADASERSDKTDYVCYLNGEILSLVIETRTIDSPTSWFDVYNINVSTGKQLDNQSLVKLSGISLNEAYGMVYSKIEDVFDNVQSDWVDSSVLEDVKSKSLATGNIESSKFFYDKDGTLCATYMYNWFAGGGIVGDVSALSASIL